MKSRLFTARDAAIAIVAAAVAAAIALLVRLPSDAKASDFLSLVGTFAGAAIAIIGSLIVVSRQLERDRDRHHHTAEILFQDVIDRFEAIERLVDDSRRDEDTADRIRPLLTDSPISLRVAATAIDRIRVESPALAQIAGPVDAWPSMADKSAENVKYVSKDLVFDAYDVLRYAAEDAGSSRKQAVPAEEDVQTRAHCSRQRDEGPRYMASDQADCQLSCMRIARITRVRNSRSRSVST